VTTKWVLSLIILCMLFVFPAMAFRSIYIISTKRAIQSCVPVPQPSSRRGPSLASGPARPSLFTPPGAGETPDPGAYYADRPVAKQACVPWPYFYAFFVNLSYQLTLAFRFF
jgi:hypothetical protein